MDHRDSANHGDSAPKGSVLEAASVAVVTGASSGIGQAIAMELAKKGLHVYGLARRLPDYFDNPAAGQTIGRGFLRPVRADVTDDPAFRHAIARIIALEGRLDCLVQAAGFGIAGSVEDTSAEEAYQQINTNFFGATNGLPPVLKQMRQQKRGLIVQIGSVAGALTIPFQAYYSASKAALTALTLALGDEVRPWGIHCMLVQPGDMRTGFTGARRYTVAATGSDYEARCCQSINKMAADEMSGKPASDIAPKIVRKMMRRRPPLVFTPGFFYKAIVMLSQLLPLRFVRWGVSRLYA
jgi:short-subunit dehydrogenase